jgi:alpha-beta hydrolase superfamily lysophospholipase
MGGGIGLLLGAGPNPPPVNGYILSAPAVWGGPTMPTLYRVSAQVVARLDPARRLSSRHVVVLPTDNKAALRAFSRDPLTIHAPRADSLTGLIDLMDQAQSACAHFTQPALILYGGHDQLVPKDAMRRCWQVLPATAPVTLAYYPQGYHLLPRDTDRATPNADILAFILGQGLPSSAPSAATVFLATGD